MLVRFLVLAVALTIAGPAFATQPSVDDSATTASEFGFEHWVGKQVDDLRAALGEPKKVKRGSFVYRVLILCGSEMYGPPLNVVKTREGNTLPWDKSDADAQEFLPRRAVAKQITVAFRTGEDNLVTGYEVRRIKNKKCPE